VADAPPAVIVDGLQKTFRVPHERVHTLKERLLHPLRRASNEQFEALKEVSFEVTEGEFFGILGRNGSGKSTLLKCLAGIYRADGGAAYARGTLASFIELGVGFNMDLAARDNIRINAVMLGLNPREARRREDEIIAFAGLEQFVDLKIKNYSSGMLVRLGFAIMVHVDADVLLIDEVLAVGDAAFQQKCYDQFNRIRDEGRTVLLVTHDLSAIERYCDRALLIESGEVVGLGDPHELAQEYLRINFGQEVVAAQSDDEDEEADPGEATGKRQARYGDQRAEIVRAWFEDEGGERVTTLESGRPCTFVAQVRVKEALADPLFGFNLYNGDHVNVLAASTLAANQRTGAFAPGDELTFRIRFVNVFRPDRYYASPAIAHSGGGFAWIDCREDFVSVVVTGTHQTNAVADLPFEIELDREQVRAS
jgi:ABC-2 type transport system ATP-binding protein